MFRNFSWKSALIGSVGAFVVACVPAIGDVLIKGITAIRSKIGGRK